MRAPFRLAACAAVVALAGCDFGPFGGGISGIIETDANGEGVGEVDRDDWRVTGCEAPNDGPPTLAVSPARPNPARYAAAVRVNLARSGAFTMTLEDEDGDEVAVLAETYVEMGAHEVVVSREQDGRTLGEGLHRVRIQFGDCRSYGDVRFSDGAPL